MCTKFAIKTAVLTFLLAITLTFVAGLKAYAGGPQPKKGGPQLAGKTVDGFLNVVVVDPAIALDPGEILGEVGGNFTVETIVIDCKDNQVLIGPAISTFIPSETEITTIDAECSDGVNNLCLEGLVLDDVAANPDLLSTDCFPDTIQGSLDDLVITRVKNFIRTSSSISAEITLQLGQ
jgi:hypothetical protein